MNNIVFESPNLSHIDDIMRIVSLTEKLDSNSSYFYAMFCSRFSETSAVALRGNEVIAFLIAFRCPKSPRSYFLWQTATKPRHGVPNLGLNLIEWAVKRERRKGCDNIEASIDVANTPISLLMKLLNKSLRGKLSEEPFFDSNLLSRGSVHHHDETLLRISLGQLES